MSKALLWESQWLFGWRKCHHCRKPLSAGRLMKTPENMSCLEIEINLSAHQGLAETRTRIPEDKDLLLITDQESTRRERECMEPHEFQASLGNRLRPCVTKQKGIVI